MGRINAIEFGPLGLEYVQWLSKNRGDDWQRLLDACSADPLNQDRFRAYADFIEENFVVFRATRC